MDENHSVILTAVERVEVSMCLTGRRKLLDNESKRLVEMGVGTSVVDEVLAIHRGDGAVGGLVAKFAPQDNVDMFEGPEPTGALRALEGKKTPPLGLDKDLAVVIATLSTKPWDKRQVVDSDGNVFEVHVQVSVTFDHKGQKCAKVGCTKLQTEAPCKAKDCPHKAPKPEGKPEPKEPATADQVSKKVMTERRNLAIAAIQGASDMPVPWRERHVLYAEQEAGVTWLQEAASRKDGEAFPEVPKDWEPAGPKDALDLTGLNFTQAAKILATERKIPRELLDGKGSGVGGTITKDDVVQITKAMEDAPAEK